MIVCLGSECKKRQKEPWRTIFAAINVDIEYEEKYLSILKNIVLQKFKDEKCFIFLFGSRARGKYRRDSDYDKGVQNVNPETFLIKNGILR